MTAGPPDGGLPYAERTVVELLDALGRPGPGPAGGSAAALAAALAASLVRLVAAVSRSWVEASDVREQALVLEQRLVRLADEDAAAWVRVIRDPADVAARAAARKVPLEIADAAGAIAELARSAAAHCAPHVRADAATAVHLADAAYEAGLGVAAANE
jgi:formiminotetrahydrofolate cyclodeaminase